MTAAFMEGLKPLQKRLDALKKGSRESIERSAVRAGLNVIGSGIKKGLSTTVKHVRPSVKSRFKRGRVRIVAKVGFGVGPRNKKQTKTRDRKDRGGVGISANNIHWWLLGTKQRSTKSGKNTGIMPAQQPGMVPRAYAANKAAAFKKMVDAARKRLDKEAAKLRKVK